MPSISGRPGIGRLCASSRAGSVLELVAVVDDGQGVGKDIDFSKLARDGHFGLLGISERVAALGGRIHMDQELVQGFQLVIEIPHPRSNGNHILRQSTP